MKVKILKNYFLLIPIVLTLSLASIDYRSIIFCHTFMIFYALFIISISSLRDIRVCILIFTILYSFSISLSFYFLASTDLGQGKADLFVNINTNSVISALNYNLFWMSGIIIHLLMNINYMHQKLINYWKNYLNKNKNLKSKNMNYLIIIIFFMWLLSVARLDWGRINDEYTLEGVGMSFGLSYVIFSYISARYLNFKSLQTLDYFILIFLIIVFSLIGARQPLFWGFIMLGIVCTFVKFKENLILLHFIRVKNFLKYSAIIFIIIISLSLIVWYRVSRDPSGILAILSDLEIRFILNLFVRLLIAETVYTFYNLMSVMQHNLNGVISLGVIFNDFFIQLIPSFILPNKYKLMETYKIVNQYELAPFGTSYVVGTLALAASSPILLGIYAYLYCSLIKVLIKTLFFFSNSYIERTIIYCLFYVFSGAYIIRGSIFGGLKLAITLSLVLILFCIIERIKLKK